MAHVPQWAACYHWCSKSFTIPASEYPRGSANYSLLKWVSLVSFKKVTWYKGANYFIRAKYSLQVCWEGCWLYGTSTLQEQLHFACMGLGFGPRRKSHNLPSVAVAHSRYSINIMNKGRPLQQEYSFSTWGRRHREDSHTEKRLESTSCPGCFPAMWSHQATLHTAPPRFPGKQCEDTAG